MELNELRQKFIKYFESLGYASLPASSLIPENDPSVLFTTAGMQQFKSFYRSPTEAPYKKVTTVQPVVRTSDIAEVGDDTHLTSFEMLGNFRFGESDVHSMKNSAISEAWKFITGELGVEKERIYVTVFGGEQSSELSADTVAESIWQSMGVEVRRCSKDDNFWGPTGDEGPCGPTTEIHVDGVEVWNLVFNEYYQTANGDFSKLDTIGLDTGSGLERLASTLQSQPSVWAIEPFASWVDSIDPTKQKESRIIIDHLRAIIFLISADVLPANKGREYILRRLIRKAVFIGSSLNSGINWPQIVKEICQFYGKHYQLKNETEIMDILLKEKEQFEKNLDRARRYLDQWLLGTPNATEEQVTKLAFYMYESFGFPKELVVEYLAELGRSVDNKHFSQLFTEHQEISRAGSEKQFKGGLADHEPQTIKHHTAHHLLLSALRQVLGDTVFQRGSNVTSERLRMDFSFDRKLSEEEIKAVEDIVNEKISEDLPVIKEEMSKDKALESGALAEFGQKYGDIVSVYTIGNFSKELCGGPHVQRTSELGHFTILKEEASAQGVRRIKAKVSSS